MCILLEILHVLPLVCPSLQECLDVQKTRDDLGARFDSGSMIQPITVFGRSF
ncbi:MAG: hypothetical protein Q7U74_10335 [Saprospiraceae bacterium]|nr:hypothetical protein [Saprospiraceae bacterium]